MINRLRIHPGGTCPAEARKPVPVLLNLSFTANSNTVDDPGVKPGEVWGLLLKFMQTHLPESPARRR